MSRLTRMGSAAARWTLMATTGDCIVVLLVMFRAIVLLSLHLCKIFVTSKEIWVPSSCRRVGNSTDPGTPVSSRMPTTPTSQNASGCNTHGVCPALDLMPMSERLLVPVQTLCGDVYMLQPEDLGLSRDTLETTVGPFGSHTDLHI